MGINTGAPKQIYDKFIKFKQQQLLNDSILTRNVHTNTNKTCESEHDVKILGTWTFMMTLLEEQE